MSEQQADEVQEVQDGLLQVRVSSDLLRAIDEAAGLVPRSVWVRQTLRAGLGKPAPKAGRPAVKHAVREMTEDGSSPAAMMVCPVEPGCPSRTRTSRRDYKCRVHDALLVPESEAGF
jgi:hypothetical protein